MTDDHRKRTAIALEDVRRVASPPALTPDAVLLVNRAVEDLTAALGSDDAAPMFAIGPSKRAGCVRLTVEVEIDTDSLNRFAAALPEVDRG